MTCPECGTGFERVGRQKYCTLNHMARAGFRRRYKTNKLDVDYMERKRANDKAIKQKRRDAGLCARCGKYPLVHAWVCEICMTAHYDRR